MRKYEKIIIIFMIFFLSGCSSKENNHDSQNISMAGTNDNQVHNLPSDIKDSEIMPDESPELRKPVQMTDFSNYFQEITGCVVIYDEIKEQYLIFNSELSEKRSSPCSTFKIISAVIGLQSQILESEATVITWNGIRYPVDEWNQDMTLKRAFQSSCVWYFREVIDKAGKDAVQDALAKLEYGNCDISQWEGSDANSDFRELNGFWLESSLLISPMEQVDALIRIFSGSTDTYKPVVPVLKNIMLIDIDNTNSNSNIYGKTGTGYKDGHCVDAWFVGIAEKEGRTIYFAVRLDEPDNTDVSGQKAKEIAISIINDLK